MKQRCCSSGDSQVSGFIRYTHWEVLAGTVNVLSCIGLPCFFPSKSVTFISNIVVFGVRTVGNRVDIEAVVLPDRIDEDWSKDSFGFGNAGLSSYRNSRCSTRILPTSCHSVANTGYPYSKDGSGGVLPVRGRIPCPCSTSPT